MKMISLILLVALMAVLVSAITIQDVSVPSHFHAGNATNTTFIEGNTTVVLGGKDGKSKAWNNTWNELNESRVLYMDFDNNTKDGSGYGNDGTANGGINFGTSVEGKINTSGQSDGVSDWLSVANSASLNNGNVTVSLWVRHENTSVITTDTHFFNKKNTNAATVAFFISNAPTSGIPDSVVFRIRLAGSEGTEREVLETVPITNHEWMHYVGTYDGTDLKLYVDGTLTDTLNIAGAIDTANGDILSLFSHPNPAFFWKGSMDEVMMFNRSLTATEVSILYQGQLNKTDMKTGNFISKNFTIPSGEQLNGLDYFCSEECVSFEYDIDNSGSWTNCDSNCTSIAGTGQGVTYKVTLNSSSIFDNATIFTETIIPPVNTSLKHIEINISEFDFDSAADVLAVNVSLNAFRQQQATFRGSGQAQKTGGSSSTLSTVIKVNGVPIINTSLRTISSSTDIGVFTIPLFSVPIEIGTNEITVSFSENGVGAVNISNFVLDANSNETNKNFSIIDQITQVNTSYSSTSFINIANFSITKSFNSSTFVDVQHIFRKTSGGGSSTPDCYLINNQTDERTVIYTRFLSGLTDVGNTGTNYRSKLTTQGAESWEMWCRSDDADTIETNMTVNLFELTDSNQNNITGFQNETLSLQSISNNNNLIGSFNNYKPRNNGSIEIAVSIYAQSASGAQIGDSSPTFFLNATGLSTVNCSTQYRRSLSANTDIGTIKFYASCVNLTVGNPLDFNVYSNVATGETLNILNFSMSAYETADFDTVAGNTPPIVIINNPVDGTTVEDLIEVNATVFEFQGDNFTSNVTITNGTFEFFIGSNLPKENLSIPYNTTVVADGLYNITWTAIENETMGRLNESAIIQIEIMNNPLGNISAVTITELQSTQTISTAFNFNTSFSCNAVSNCFNVIRNISTSSTSCAIQSPFNLTQNFGTILGGATVFDNVSFLCSVAETVDFNVSVNSSSGFSLSANASTSIVVSGGLTPEEHTWAEESHQCDVTGKLLNGSDCATIQEVKKVGNGLAITLFMMAIVGTLFTLSFKVKRFSENIVTDHILRRGTLAIAVFLLMMTSSMVATLASSSGIPLTQELLRVMWLAGRTGWIILIWLGFGTIIKIPQLWKEQTKQINMGGL